jgi:Holliday junction resolvase RusA-like endonuclease
MNITVYGKPLGQPRQRVAVRGGHGVNYLPGDHPIHGFKNDVKRAWTSAEFGRLDGPVKCTITAIFQRPASKTRKRGDNPRLAHTSKPDCDNLAKGILDALNGVAFKDDSQVVELVVRKFTGTPDELARVEVSIEQTGASK